ncbi:SAM-dependent methyltransferase [Paenibacillus sp. MY03]|jgi:SAM-dependent methyltransferase|uniref:class I SAM-dependent methyltransferase n=1 Tax=Paenibacillus sp. MY03 TaxID=302980 RepID=UPI000B3CC2FC|nr:SAM-dependent methyltransferase [Paenibacillus sp. MY03]OUS71154.1 SAM-dependent methyltransferase [Paenibacillus sp. MY03]
MSETGQEEWQRTVAEWMERGEMLHATLSQPRRRDDDTPPKTVVRPVAMKDGLHYQFESHYKAKVLHRNLKEEEASETLLSLLKGDYRQALIKTPQADVQLLFSKKGKAAVRRLAPTAKSSVPMEHNRKKRRVLEEGTPVPFLVELGIMTPEGRVHAKKQDKFRQINRFLEMVSDVLDDLPAGRELRIVDFGCGKSYLTFALYHLLAVELGRPISVVGLDLKADVIQFCSELAGKLGYDRLQFLVGDIAEYEGLTSADMVVTLHACDTATDAALAKAVGWGASVIMSVPCCQHELFGQVESEVLAPILSQGLLKERFAALATDAVRGQLLETLGYKVQMLEFVDPEHTPKNLLIRAVVSGRKELSLSKWQEYEAFKSFLGLSPALERMLPGAWPVSR